MPKLGLTMETGTIGAWLVGEGEDVIAGQPLLEVVTDKVTMEVEARASGVLRRILVPAGTEVEVATPIGLIGSAEEDLAMPVESPAPPTSTARAGAKPPSLPAPPAPGQRARHRASPKARRMAAERGLELSTIAGTGAGGRVVAADVDTGAQALGVSSSSPPPSAGGGARLELSRAQEIAAARLAMSSREAPHVHFTMDVSATGMVEFREQWETAGQRPSYNDLILRATARTLGEFPRFNAILDEDGLRGLEDVDIGIATDTPNGLLVPVLRRASTLSLEELVEESGRLTGLARRGQLGPDDLAGGSFTVSNLGMLGVRSFTAIINPPQVALLAVGAVERRVVPLEDGDGIAVRPIFTASLAIDHRALDGAMAARFLLRFREILEAPGSLA